MADHGKVSDIVRREIAAAKAASAGYGTGLAELWRLTHGIPAWSTPGALALFHARAKKLGVKLGPRDGGAENP